MNTSTELERWLQDFLTKYNGAAGTIHLFEDGGLRLATAINIPTKYATTAQALNQNLHPYELAKARKAARKARAAASRTKQTATKDAVRRPCL